MLEGWWGLFSTTDVLTKFTGHFETVTIDIEPGATPNASRVAVERKAIRD